MKPKEALIDKIDRLSDQLLKRLTKLSSDETNHLHDIGVDIQIVEKILHQIHTMNIHKVKVAYFSGIKGALHKIYSIAGSAIQRDGGFSESEKEELLRARNELHRALPEY
ncbi:MAG: hypothetical protein ACNI27_05690 [Desulfovibrio sp.]